MLKGGYGPRNTGSTNIDNLALQVIWKIFNNHKFESFSNYLERWVEYVSIPHVGWPKYK